MNAAWPIAGLLIVAFIAGCSAPPKTDAQPPGQEEPARPLAVADQPVTHHVHAAADAFDPSALTIQKGEAVTWHVHDGTHEILVHKEGDPEGTYTFQQTLGSGAEASYTFADAGMTYHVFCKKHSMSMHQGMTMRLSVA